MNILYHYCSVNSFLSIVKNKEIFLSSLSLSNDSLEGLLVEKTISRMAEKDSLNLAHRAELEKSISMLRDVFDGFGFCLSSAGDLLSQWRGYASDGAGFSIGFSQEYLNELCNLRVNGKPSGITLEQVIYSSDDHESVLGNIYSAIKENINAGAFSLGLNFLGDEGGDDEKKRNSEYMSYTFAILSLFSKLYKLKSHAFMEEKEWRVIAHHIKKSSDIKCEFRAAYDRLIPYRILSLAPLNQVRIKEVLIGPKNNTPLAYVEEFLENNGFDDVKVKRSDASYR